MPELNAQFYEGREFMPDEMDDDDVVVDVIILARVVRKSEIGSGKSSLILLPEHGCDPVIVSGLLNNAVDVYYRDGIET